VTFMRSSLYRRYIQTWFIIWFNICPVVGLFVYPSR